MDQNGRTLDEIFSNFLNNYMKYGKIGNTRPYNADHARKIAWAAAYRIINKNKNKKQTNTTSSPTRQGAEPLTACQTCCQLKMF